MVVIGDDQLGVKIQALSTTSNCKESLDGQTGLSYYEDDDDDDNVGVDQIIFPGLPFA